MCLLNKNVSIDRKKPLESAHWPKNVPIEKWKGTNI